MRPLGLLGADELREDCDEHDRRVWRFPPLDARERTDPSWAATLDTLRAPRKRDQKLTEWRREAPIRPVVFEDAGVLTDEVVHLHLEQRVAQRLLARFRSQGFIYHDLSRACLAQTNDAIPRVLLLGRLSLYGQGAERLHEEIVTLTARWVEPSRRSPTLVPYGREAEARTLELLQAALCATERPAPSETTRRRLLESAARDVGELLPLLEERAVELALQAEERLRRRGELEADRLAELLERQRERVTEELARFREHSAQLVLGLLDGERRQLEADARWWQVRLGQFERELASEPDRIRGFYEVRARRVEPLGLVYLWPVTG